MAPAEARLGGGARALRLRAAQAQRLSGGRLRVTPYGDFGYVVSTRTGASSVRPDLAGLVDALLELGGPAVRLVEAARAEPDDGAGRGLVAQAVLDRAGAGDAPR